MKKLFLLLSLVLINFHSYSQFSKSELLKSISANNDASKNTDEIINFTKNFKLNESEKKFVFLLIDSLLPLQTDKKNSVIRLTKKAGVLSNQNDHNGALPLLFKALKEAEKTASTDQLTYIHHRISDAYFYLKNPEYAIKHAYFSLRHFFKYSLIDSTHLANIYTSFGNSFKNLKKYDSALHYHRLAESIHFNIGNKNGLSYAYNNIAINYRWLDKPEMALIYLNKSLQIKKELNDIKGMAATLINTGNIYNDIKNRKEAEKYYKEGIKMAYEAKAASFLTTGLEALALSYFESKDYKNSAEYFKEFKLVSDSIFQIGLNQQLAELSTQYQSQQKDAEIALQQEQLKTKSEQNAKQKVLILASTIAFIMALIAIVVVYRSYKQNKRNALELQDKNKVIEEKNKEITDSINYARLIQQSLLASESILHQNLKEHFVLYKPKDIVSGDFYWAHESSNGFLIAAVDCTGHGVPGAFMSLIGKENLDKAVKTEDSPGKILAELNRNVKNSLKQNQENGSRDGMDAALLKIKTIDADSAEVRYSGANRPLYILKNESGLITEIKPTKQAIGGFTPDNQLYEEHTAILNTNDMVFMCSDGYADQFGGTHSKKLSTKRFKELLISLHHQSPQKQKEALDAYFNDWKGNQEQLDDILVIGIKI
jgi:serine phosphatase RsbU (regulator of sigma subunit)/tetratricopeptide (TPR) repeat protein